LENRRSFWLKVSAPLVSGRSRQTYETRADLEFHAAGAKTPEPCAQKSCGFLSARKDASARPDVRLNAEFLCPRAQIVWPKFVEQIAPAFWCIDVTRRKIFDGLAMSEVQSTPAGYEKFPAHGTLRVANGDVRARRSRDFRRAQSRRSASDDEDRFGISAHQLM
jgi:hypothetical protein